MRCFVLPQLQLLQGMSWKGAPVVEASMREGQPGTAVSMGGKHAAAAFLNSVKASTEAFCSPSAHVRMCHVTRYHVTDVIT